MQNVGEEWNMAQLRKGGANVIDMQLQRWALANEAGVRIRSLYTLTRGPQAGCKTGGLGETSGRVFSVSGGKCERWGAAPLLVPSVAFLRHSLV